MILLSNSIYDKIASNSYNSIVRTEKEQKDQDSREKYNGSRESFGEDAASLEISSEGVRRLHVSESAKANTETSYYNGAETGRKETENFNLQESADKKDDVENVTARIQKYISRSIQLENEAKSTDITQAERQTIKNEISKIDFVVNNLRGSHALDVTKMMEHNIQMKGDLVRHSSKKIVSQAEDAIQAQTKITNEQAYQLLA